MQNCWKVILAKCRESSVSEQNTFVMNIQEIESGVHALCNDTCTMMRGRTMADTIEDERQSS